MFTTNNLGYQHPNKDVLFSGIQITLQKHDKVSLIGNNGVGKSTLLRVLAGELASSEGSVDINCSRYYVPQILGQYNHLTISQVWGVDKKLASLKAILEGSVSVEDFEILNEDWEIEERCQTILKRWALPSLFTPLAELSGGQKMKVFLGGIELHEPEMVLMDEPTNHLDANSRQFVYDWLTHTQCTVLVVSHDRKLLNLVNKTMEMTKTGMNAYGGNFYFYSEQKERELEALNHEIHSAEKALRKAKEKERETKERQQKLDARGQKKQAKAGMPRILMGMMQNKAESTASVLKKVHNEKVGALSDEIVGLRTKVADKEKMALKFAEAGLHKGKVLFKAEGVNFTYENAHYLWHEALEIEIRSGERVAIKGGNGSGKSTLLQIMLGQLKPTIGQVTLAAKDILYLDQDCSILNPEFSVYEQVSVFCRNLLPEHEVKMGLDRFLFGKEDWAKKCSSLSGGERMRLVLCGMGIAKVLPEMLVLDEPSNNLDLKNLEILTTALRQFKGTLLVVSHDETFLEEIGISREICL